MSEEPTNKPSWKYRRRYLYVVTFFTMFCIGWVLYKDMTSSPADSMVTMGIILIGSMVGSYVFAAVWDDKIHK